MRKSKAAIQNEWRASVAEADAHVPFNVKQFYQMNQNNGNSHKTVINPFVLASDTLPPHWKLRNIKIFEFLHSIKAHLA